MSQPRAYTLDEWLAMLPDLSAGHRLVGGTGHLQLDAVERRNVENRLESDIFPLLFSSARHVTIVTGAAPGADLLFARTAQRWLTRAGVSHDLAALLPLPLDTLLDDWTLRLRELAATPDGPERTRVHRAVRALVDECSTVVHLLPASIDRQQLDPPALRQYQYQRLAAVLAEQSDLLVAVLRDAEPQRPGGTAEVVDWRQHPERIPAALSTLDRRRPSQQGQLWVIDPVLPVEARHAPPPARGEGSVADGSAGIIRQAREALGSGNYLRCHDLVRRAQDRGLVSRELDYLSLLALANAGSTELALKRYRRLAPAGTADEDWLALEGRLLKDQAALTAGERAAPLLLAAAEAYHAAFERTGGRYPALNAATMYLLGGEVDAALRLARNLLAGLVTTQSIDETDDYYRHVTEAEAALLLGEVQRAGAALARADTLLRGNLNVRSRTLAQLGRICRHLRIDPALLETLRLPPVACLLHPRPTDDSAPALESLIRERAFLFADLTDAPALDALEPILRTGLRVHLVLAALPATLIERWRHFYGDALAARLEAAIAAAHDVSVAHGFIAGEDAWCRDYVGDMARGLSWLMARRLGCRWMELQPAAMPAADTLAASTPADAQGRYGRRFVGTLFADFVGFSRLGDDELPAFWSAFTALVDELTSRHGSRLLYHRTWGDALHVVATDAGAVAEIALDLRAALERLRPGLTGRTARLELRLAAHHAPVYVDDDTASGRAQFFGTQLSFAARVEPVTPPGSVFVTEAFAARLALEAGERYHFEYAGEIDLPKEFGKYRLFGLRRVSATA